MRISDWSSDVCSSDLGRIVKADEELAVRRIRIGAARHRTDAADMRFGGKFRLQIRLLRSAHSGAGRIAALGHESIDDPVKDDAVVKARSEEHTSELQSLMRTSYAVFCLNKKKK